MAETDQKHGVKIGVAVVLLAIAAGVLFWTFRPRTERPPTEAYFYDLGTSKLFPMPLATQAPVAPPTGGTEKTGVRAYVFSCGDCSNEEDRFIGYLETSDPPGTPQGNGAEAPQTGPPALRAAAGRASVFVATEQEKNWHPIQSDRGRQIITEAQAQCGAQAPTACFPEPR